METQVMDCLAIIVLRLSTHPALCSIDTFQAGWIKRDGSRHPQSEASEGTEASS